MIAYIVIQLLFAAGLRPPYSRVTDSVLGFLRDVCEPFLRIFRGIIPSLRGLRLQPDHRASSHCSSSTASWCRA